MNSDNTAWGIVLAGGVGQRFSTDPDNPIDKLTILLGGKPILVRTLEAFLESSAIQGILLVAHPSRKNAYADLIAPWISIPSGKTVHFAIGGDTRRESVYSGLCALPPHVEIAAIHDAARPLIRPSEIDMLVETVKRHVPTIIPAIPITDTLKKVRSGIVESTLDRSALWRAQTPQVFRKNVILQAHQTVPHDTPVTDDAQLVELSQLAPVSIMEGSVRNIKITTPDDFALAEFLLQQN